MRNIFFWQRWPAPERILFNLAALLFISAAVCMAYYYVVTPAPVIEFQSLIEPAVSEVPFETFRKGVFDLVIPGNNYTLTERLLGTPLEPGFIPSYLWLACFAICITGLLAVATTASRYYYLASMGVFILLIASLKLETLLMFGRDDRLFSVMVLLAYGLCSFHIYYFLPALKFGWRFGYFAVVTVLMTAVIFLFSEAEVPALHLATYSYPAGMIAAVLFIVTVAHEIIAAFIMVLTRTVRQGRTMNHFLLITLVYMLNLVASYAIRFGFVKWNIFTIDLFLLLTISAVLGIWGFRQRSRQMEDILDMEPFGVMGFTMFGALAMGAIAYFIGTANDPAYEAVADMIIFSHLGYGVIFVFYVISNFGNMLQQNMAVHKVLYNPTSMPFFTFRLAGVIATLALIIYNSWQVPAHNAVAGYQNAVADLYLAQGNTRVATVFYDQGRTYGFSNHHSNYGLANLAGLKFDHNGEKGFYKSASYLRPTEMSILNWAQMWQSEDDNEQAIGVLEEGLKSFPRSSAIANALGLLHAEAGRPDSAAMYLQDAPASYSQANLLALAARGQLPLLADTSYRFGDNASILANKIAFATSVGQKSGMPLLIGNDTTISNSLAAYINNYVVNHPGMLDTTQLKQIEQLARYDVNVGAGEALLFATALGSSSNGDINHAFRLLEEVAIVSSGKGRFNNILGLWCLQQDEPLRAQGYIEYALSQGYDGAVFTNAVALTEALRYAPVNATQNFRVALTAWDSVVTASDSSVAVIGKRMIAVLTATPASVAEMEDENKYAYARYRIQPWNYAEAVRILSSISDINITSRGLLEWSRLLLDYDDLAGANAVFQRLRGIAVTDTALHDDIRLHERLLLAAAGDVGALQKLEAESPLALEGRKSVYRYYFNGVVSLASGDTTQASTDFRHVTGKSLFFTEGIIAAANYYAQHGTDPLMSYSLLVDAVQHHPSSIRLRKAYIKESIRIGFTDYAANALEEMRGRLRPEDFNKFSAEISIIQ